MAVASPSERLLAVLHVGPLSVLQGHSADTGQTPQQQPLSIKYELHGAAVDVCRQIMSQTLLMSEPHVLQMTKHAADLCDAAGRLESLKLVPASTFLTVALLLFTFLNNNTTYILPPPIDCNCLGFSFYWCIFVLLLLLLLITFVQSTLSLHITAQIRRDLGLCHFFFPYRSVCRLSASWVDV